MIITMCHITTTTTFYNTAVMPDKVARQGFRYALFFWHPERKGFEFLASWDARALKIWHPPPLLPEPFQVPTALQTGFLSLIDSRPTECGIKNNPLRKLIYLMNGII